MLMPKLENFCLDIKINDDGVFQNTFIEKLLIKTIVLSKPFFSLRLKINSVQHLKFRN